MVARGFSQECGIDYKETFAPVIHLDALRLILAMSAIHGWDMQQMDIKGAYLNGELKETIFMMQPPGYEDGSKSVLLLIHSLYGLKQSGRAWYHKLKEILLKHNFEQVTVEHCLYIRRQNGKLQIISAWVDDLLLIGPDPDSTNEIKGILGREFEVHDMEEPHFLTGMGITQDHRAGTVTLLSRTSRCGVGHPVDGLGNPVTVDARRLYINSCTL